VCVIAKLKVEDSEEECSEVGGVTNSLFMNSQLIMKSMREEGRGKGEAQEGENIAKEVGDEK